MTRRNDTGQAPGRLPPGLSIPPDDKLLSRLDGVKQTGPGKWLARCPAHDDRSPSLAVKLADDGRLLVHCFAGCDLESVVAAVGLTLSDLFPAKLPDPTYDRGKRLPVPRFRADELVSLAAFECGVAAIIIEDFLAGKELDAATVQRLRQASETLDDIIREVSGHD